MKMNIKCTIACIVAVLSAGIFSCGFFDPFEVAGLKPFTKIYWVDDDGASTMQIQRSNLDGSGIETLFGTATPAYLFGGIAIDRTAEKIYWIEADSFPASSSDIYSANLDGSSRVKLYHDTFDLRNLALDPALKKVYFMRGDNFFRIDYSSVNQASAEQFMTETYATTSMKIDFVGRRIYWLLNDATPPTTYAIRSSDMNGGDIRTIANKPELDLGPVSIAVFPGRPELYFTKGNKVCRVYTDKLAPQNVINVIEAAGAGPQFIAIDTIAERLFWTDYNPVAIPPAPKGIIYTALIGETAPQTIHSDVNPIRGIALF